MLHHTLIALALAGAGALMPSLPVHAAPAAATIQGSPDKAALAELGVIRERLTANARREGVPNADSIRKSLRELSPAGTWPDLNYADTANGHWSPSEHLSRVQRMALAYAIPTLGENKPNPHFHNAPLLDGLLRAYDGWFSALPPGTPCALAKPGNAFKDDLTTPTSKNWWHNEIGVPLKMSAILLLLPEISGERLGKGLQILARSHVPHDTSGINTGANLSWRARVTIARAAITGDAALLREVVASVDAEARVTDGTGIQPDYSFWQHGPQLYLLGYGQGTSLDVTELAELLRGTSFTFRPEILQLLTDLTLDGYQWAMRGPVGDYNAMGRGIANQRKDDAANLLTITQRLLATGAPRRAELEAFQGRLMKQPGAAPLVGNRAFWRSGYMSHQRADYGVSVRVTSQYLRGGELINGQGVQSRYTGDGVTFLLRDGDEYRNLSPALNFRRLPGVTGALSPQKPTMPGSYVWGVGSFAGGVSDGMYGATGYDYARDGVSARKGWFFFDEEYVCLGAGITSEAGVADPVVSSIEQRRSSAPIERSPNGAWLAQNGVGYVFLSPPRAVTAHVGPQTGSWRDVNSDATDKKPITEQVFSLYLDHGVRPQNASYACVVVPRIATQRLPAYAAAPPVSVLSNTPQLQAVRHAKAGITQAVFYGPGTLTIRPGLTLSASRACLLLLREATMTITVADPDNPPLRQLKRAAILAAAQPTARTRGSQRGRIRSAGGRAAHRVHAADGNVRGPVSHKNFGEHNSGAFKAIGNTMERRDFLKLTGAAVAATLPATERAGAQTKTMELQHMTYPLQDGWVHNWLVAGPQNTPVAPGEYKFDADLRPPLVKQFFTLEPLVSGAPVEGTVVEAGKSLLSWKYFRCEDDHLIDLSAWHPKSDYVRAWAFCVLHSPTARTAKFELCTNGPAVCLVNGKNVLSHREFDYYNIHRAAFDAPLQAGASTVLIRFDQLMTRNGPHTMALHLANPDGVQVQIPTRTEDVARRQALEAAFEEAYLGRDSYGDGQEIRLNVPSLPHAQGKVEIELLSGKNAVRTFQWDTATKAPFIALGTASQLKEGGYQVRLSSGGGENVRQIEVEVAKDAFSPTPYGTYEERRIEALSYAAGQGEGLRREAARMALGRWKEVDQGVIARTIEGVAAWKDGADGELMNLLGVLIRYGDNPAFPAELKKPIQDVALKFRYWTDEPGQTAMTYGSENHQITFLTAEILAGQLYPDRVFSNNKKSGAWHRQHGEKLALSWLQNRLSYGFEEWDANGYLAADMAILSHLILAQDPRLREGAAQVMHKILFGIAVGSWKGCYGTAHSRTQGQYLKDARHEPVSCIARLMWGVGAWNHGIGSTAAVAGSSYRVPPVVAAVALDQPAQMWATQRQGLPKGAERSVSGPVDTVVFKTPDFLLASAQEFKPGAGGENQQQQIWQATLGPEAGVWVNHPACISENGNRRPNFWMGQATFPRVAQWKDVLVAVHRFRPADWLDWTHAYFPTFAFEEHVLQDGWAFARVGDGYLALRAQGGLSMVTRGKSALRELRSPGRQNVWLCQMGRKGTDGDWASFRKKVVALPVSFGPLKVSWTTLRGQRLEFGWDSPLRLDGKEQPITNFPHFDNPYAQAPWPAKTTEIRHGTQSLTLDFSVPAA